MKNKVILFYIIMSLVCNMSVKASDQNMDIKYLRKAKQDILVLMLSYKSFIKNVTLENNSDIYLVMNSGKKILYDDKKKKTNEEKLINADIQDTLEDIYPLEYKDDIQEDDFDPGRCRNYELLNEVYGHSKTEISKNLKNLTSVYPNYEFNKNNNACASLDNALKEVSTISKSNSKVGALLYPGSGTFNYRVIKGTGRLSPHSYGIAIDLKSSKYDYWKWNTKENGKKRIKEYPSEMVSAFENNNFIWGGKWAHFDILHFEYRPEIILKAKYFKEDNLEKDWYLDIKEDEYTKTCISLIDDALQECKTSFNEEDDKSLYKKIAENIFIKRNNSILTGDLKSVKSLYAKNCKLGQFAYEYELRKIKYINNWAEKQGIKFINITPNLTFKKITSNDTSVNFYIKCNTFYKYKYLNDDTKINSCGIGTYHILKLVKENDDYLIAKEWYTDPFADSLNLENLKVDSITTHIMSENERDLSDIKENRKKAISYAFKYCGISNSSDENSSYNKKYRDFNPAGGDCANFASQTLFASENFRKNSSWNYNKGEASASWVNAGKFTHYMLYSGRASLIARGSYEKVYKASYKLLPGDIVAYEKKGDITHVSVVSGADSKGYSLVTCHNTDRLNVPWDLGWSDKKITFYLIHVNF